jgi:hypothetical protein
LVSKGQIAGEQNAGKKKCFEVVHQITIPLTKLAHDLQHP